MNPRRQHRLQARAEILKAMAHPARLLVLEELARHERCVCELQKLIGSDMSTVSKHLALLRLSGLVTVRKQGTSVYYALRTPCVLNFMDCVEAVLKDHAAARQAALR